MPTASGSKAEGLTTTEMEEIELVIEDIDSIDGNLREGRQDLLELFQAVRVQQKDMGSLMARLGAGMVAAYKVDARMKETHDRMSKNYKKTMERNKYLEQQFQSCQKAVVVQVDKRKVRDTDEMQEVQELKKNKPTEEDTEKRLTILIEGQKEMIDAARARECGSCKKGVWNREVEVDASLRITAARRNDLIQTMKVRFTQFFGYFVCSSFLCTTPTIWSYMMHLTYP
jgi:hypothetical protein